MILRYVSSSNDFIEFFLASRSVFSEGTGRKVGRKVDRKEGRKVGRKENRISLAPPKGSESSSEIELIK